LRISIIAMTTGEKARAITFELRLALSDDRPAESVIIMLKEY